MCVWLREISVKYPTGKSRGRAGLTRNCCGFSSYRSPGAEEPTMSTGFALQASVVLVVFRAALAQLEVRSDVSGEWDHTFTVEIDPMEQGSNTFKYCYRGTDCTLYKFETTMQQGTADVVDSKCILRPYRGFSDFGLVPFADAPLVTDSSISLQSDDCLNQNPDGKHPCELGPLKPHGVAEDHSATLGKEEEPYLFQQFHVASRPPFLWGSFCMHPALNHFASYSVGSFFLRRESGPQH